MGHWRPSLHNLGDAVAITRTDHWRPSPSNYYSVIIIIKKKICCILFLITQMGHWRPSLCNRKGNTIQTGHWGPSLQSTRSNTVQIQEFYCISLENADGSLETLSASPRGSTTQMESWDRLIILAIRGFNFIWKLLFK